MILSGAKTEEDAAGVFELIIEIIHDSFTFFIEV